MHRKNEIWNSKTLEKLKICLFVQCSLLLQEYKMVKATAITLLLTKEMRAERDILMKDMVHRIIQLRLNLIHSKNTENVLPLVILPILQKEIVTMITMTHRNNFAREDIMVIDLLEMKNVGRKFRVTKSMVNGRRLLP